MSEFKGIDNQIQKLQNSHLSDFGKELLTELQRIKKEHSEMLDMLKKCEYFIKASNQYTKLGKDVEQLIKEATEL